MRLQNFREFKSLYNDETARVRVFAPEIELEI